MAGSKAVESAHAPAARTIHYLWCVFAAPAAAAAITALPFQEDSPLNTWRVQNCICFAFTSLSILDTVSSNLRLK
jgi:hypothetical protein